MPVINVLPEHVQNKIAAGEVLDRPSAAVKELVENAVDAGAGRVVVDIEDGGRRLIRVVDDGRGMDADDLGLAILRHATSKINDVDDIHRIQTLGFRGEALASIAAVSRFVLASTARGADAGHELRVEAGHVDRLAPAPPAAGTRVEVRDLFFNTPARLAFLRAPAAESAAAAEAVARIALARPEIGFVLRSNGRALLDLPARQSLPERIRALFGKEAAKNLRPLELEGEDGLAVGGYIAPPPESHPNSTRVYTLLNGRWFRHNGIARVVGDAFQELGLPRRYPLAVVTLLVDPARVDVNVHPTKEEVRFANPRPVIGAVRRAVTDALRPRADAQSPAPPGADADAALNAGNADAAGRAMAGSSRAGIPSPAAGAGGGAGSRPFFFNSPPARPGSGAPYSAEAGRSGPASGPAMPAGTDFAALRARLREADGDAVDFSVDTPVNPVDNAGVGGGVNGAAGDPAGDPAGDATDVSSPASGAATGLFSGGRHRVLGQAANKYLVVEGPDGLLLVDPHALHERWNYERLKGRFRPLERQRLLLPLVIELSPAERALLDVALPALRELGFDAEPFGDGALAVSSAPPLLPPAKLATAVKEVLNDLDKGEKAEERVRERLLSSLACRSAVLLGRALEPEEAVALLDMLFEKGLPATCPHGRPTAIDLSWNELERRFGRA